MVIYINFPPIGILFFFRRFIGCPGRGTGAIGAATTGLYTFSASGDGARGLDPSTPKKLSGMLLRIILVISSLVLAASYSARVPRRVAPSNGYTKFKMRDVLPESSADVKFLFCNALPNSSKYLDHSMFLKFPSSSI